MSGGSFNYLCFKDPHEMFERMDDIEQMADALAELGYADDAASETREFLLNLRVIKNRLSVAVNRLNGVWHDMEWWKSYDIGEDTFKKTLEEYREQSGAGIEKPPV